MFGISNYDNVIKYAIVLSFSVDEERNMVIFDAYRTSLGARHFSYDTDFRREVEIHRRNLKHPDPPLEIPFKHLAGATEYYTNTLNLRHGTKLVFATPADRDRLYEILAEKLPKEAPPPTQEKKDAPIEGSFGAVLADMETQMETLKCFGGFRVKFISCKSDDDDTSLIRITFHLNKKRSNADSFDSDVEEVD